MKRVVYFDKIIIVWLIGKRLLKIEEEGESIEE
jgi:hypothetical protein